MEFGGAARTGVGAGWVRSEPKGVRVKKISTGPSIGPTEPTCTCTIASTCKLTTACRVARLMSCDLAEC